MKIIFSLILFVAILNAHSNHQLTIALYGLDKKVANGTTVKKLLKNFFQKVPSLNNINIKIYTYNNKSNLLFDIKNNDKKIDLVYITPSFYIENFKLLNNISKEIMVLKQIESPYVQYYLLASEKSNIDSYNDIKKQKIGFYSSHLLSKYWFLNNYYNHTQIKEDIIIEEFSSFNQHKKLLDLYFDKLDLAIVPKHIWETAIELNPRIKNKIKILDKSANIFPPIIGLFTNEANDHLLDHYKSFVFDKNNNKDIETVLSLVRYKSIEMIDKSTYQEVYNFYQEYQKILK